MSWFLHLGECLEVLRTLPTASVDMLLMDPPYCSGGFLEAQKQAAAAQGIDSKLTRSDDFEWFPGDNMTTMGLVWLLRSVLVESRRLLKQDRGAFVFCDWRMVPALAPALESSGLRHRNMVVWDKMQPALGNGFRSQHEIVLEFTNGVTDYQAKNGRNVISCRKVPKRRRLHPTEKPQGLLREIVRVACPPGGVVLDPFAGSAAVGEAALATGRHFVGVELQPRFHKRAVRRLTALEQPTSLQVAA